MFANVCEYLNTHTPDDDEKWFEMLTIIMRNEDDFFLYESEPFFISNAEWEMKMKYYMKISKGSNFAKKKTLPF